MDQPLDILERYWSYSSFKPLQEAIIQAVLDREDVFALLPTGGGKSLCFQIPALMREGICIVISPLVALMKDQVQALNARGIKAMAISSGLSYQELDTLLDNAIYGNYKFLYLSPERLEQELVQDRIRQMPVNLIAVDEAHCISQWGNDFRPAYKNIALLRELQPRVNCIALTASATPQVVDDIVEALDFMDPKIFKQSFERSNLAYMTFKTEDKHYKLEQILNKQQGSAIVYVRNRKATIELAQHLESQGFAAGYFHGGLSPTQKEDALNQWLNNAKPIMVATNAFGMGIDKPDVKAVVHMSLPDSMESYFQEAGRAGRYGQKAFAVVLYNANDAKHLKGQFLGILPDVAFIKQLYRKLSNYFQISYGEGAQTVHDFNFNHFCKTYDFNTLLAYNALQALDRTSVIALHKQFNKQTSLQYIVRDTQVFQYVKNHPETGLIVKSLLRTYGGIFDQQTKINTWRMAEKTGLPEDRLLKTLQQLEKDELISFHYSTTDAQITFIEPREDDKTINRIASIIEQQNRLRHEQVQAVLAFIENDKLCKSVQLLNYFGETHVADCGICSVCIQNKPQAGAPANFKTLTKAIVEILEAEACTSRKITALLPYPEAQVTKALKQLLEQQIIRITETNTYTLAHI